MTENIKPGDILMFEVGDDRLSKAIGKLTKSNVCHCALAVSSNELIEMRGNGVQKKNISDYKDEIIFKLNLRDEKDMMPVINAAEKYMADGIPYDWPSLVMIGGLLVYSRFNKKLKHKRIVNPILGVACWSLDKLLIKINNSGSNEAMMCSQFVYQCYLDAGEGYYIEIENGLIFADKECDEPSLSDLLSNEDDIEMAPILTIDPSEIDEEQLAQELFDALDYETGDVEYEHLDGGVFAKTLSNAKRFMDLVEKILDVIGPDIPRPALFVTPADICFHSANLERHVIPYGK